MQIDGHHGMTYVLARMVGFKHEEADIIAYSAQYVDDATNAGTIRFDNGGMYTRISSAHGTFSIHNHLNQHENHLVWVPFHFLPGNEGLNAGDNPDAELIKKLICRPDSDTAVEMLDMCMRDSKDKPYALHRLGITMHVYADTFAHQGFAGIIHEVNEVYDLVLENEDLGMVDKAKYKLLSKRFPMGHGPALECPDKPYLRWSYTNGLDEKVTRDNTEIFMTAAQTMAGQLLRYRTDLGYPDITTELTENMEFNFAQIEKNFRAFIEQDGEERHKRWLESIAKGTFSFGPQKVTYIPKGEGSWKHNALGQEKWTDLPTDEFKFTEEFMKSDWKLFHDALQEHRLTILHDVLPKFDICVS